jgi:hypothetical protein
MILRIPFVLHRKWSTKIRKNITIGRKPKKATNEPNINMYERVTHVSTTKQHFRTTVNNVVA